MPLPANLAPPTHCHHCSTALTMKDSSPFCPNYDCTMRVYGRVQKFVDVLDIKGVGIETLKQMVEFKFVRTPADLWKLSLADYEKLDRRGEKHYQKFTQGLKDREEMTVSQFFAALDIEGSGTWDNICRVPGLQTYDEIMALWNGNHYELMVKLASAVRVSTEKAQSILKEFHDKRHDIADLRPLIRFKSTGSKMMGKVIVITGSCTARPRSELEKMVKELGGVIGGSITSKTTCMVTDDTDTNSSKAKKAREMKTKIITSQELLDMMS